MHYLSNPKQFKRSNLKGWHKNTDFWLKARLPHIRSVQSIIIPFVTNHLPTNRGVVYDIGCGNAWLLQELTKNNISASYVGIDFNDKLISNLKSSHSLNRSATFIRYDIESNPPKQFLGKAHVVVNCFNFFELPNLKAAFRNVAKLTRSHGFLIIATIDPIMQILAVSESHEQFIKHLKQYQRHGEHLAYDKKIETTLGVSSRIYKGILYSTDTLFSAAQSSGFRLIDVKRQIRTATTVPQIFDYLMFQKTC